MIPYVTATWRYVAVQDGDLVPQTGTMVQIHYPVMTVLDADTPQTVRPDPVNGIIDASGDLKAPDGTSDVLLLDPTDDRLSPHDYSVTVKVMPQDGGIPWQFDAVLTTPSGDGSYDLALNRSADPSSPQFVTQGPPGDYRRPAPYVADISGAYEVDAAHQDQILTVTGVTVLSPPPVPTDAMIPLYLVVISDGTSAVTFDPAIKWGQGSAPGMTLRAGAVDEVTLVGRPTLGWHGYYYGQDVK